MKNVFGVTPEKLLELEHLWQQIGLFEKDIEEKFIRSPGPGGQKVNKTSSGVYLKHLPTGIDVKATQSRSQPLNRFYARRMLAEHLQAKQLGKNSPAQEKQARLRKQKARRRRRAGSLTS